MARGKKKHSLLYLFPCLLFLCGLVLLVYPRITDRLYRGEVQGKKEAFEKQVEAAPLPDGAELPFEELYQELRRRNEKLYTEKQKDLADPWSCEQPGINLEEYGLEGNVIGFISIPKMEVELPILLGASAENMRQGAVHLTQTSYPIGGENTNSVIAAHRGASRTRMFRHIEKLELGDEIFIQNFRETLVYEVAELRIIDPTDVDQLLIQDGRDMVTLFTCHPYPQDTQRYVVFCVRKS